MNKYHKYAEILTKKGVVNKNEIYEYKSKPEEDEFYRAVGARKGDAIIWFGLGHMMNMKQ